MNTAQIAGGVIDLYSNAFTLEREFRLRLSNCVVWDNTAQFDLFVSETYKGLLLIVPKAVIDVSYSLVRGGYTGTGNITSDPRFIDPVNLNYQLLANSPAINAGDPDPSILYSVDLASRPRIQNVRVDMGAYESACLPAPCVPISAQRKQWTQKSPLNLFWRAVVYV